MYEVARGKPPLFTTLNASQFIKVKECQQQRVSVKGSRRNWFVMAEKWHGFSPYMHIYQKGQMTKHIIFLATLPISPSSHLYEQFLLVVILQPTCTMYMQIAFLKLGVTIRVLDENIRTKNINYAFSLSYLPIAVHVTRSSCLIDNFNAKCTVICILFSPTYTSDMHAIAALSAPPSCTWTRQVSPHHISQTNQSVQPSLSPCSHRLPKPLPLDDSYQANRP
ncbi:hypothetical protein V8C44DRAFT_70765 [Trichoderma aethiopicum]